MKRLPPLGPIDPRFRDKYEAALAVARSPFPMDAGVERLAELYRVQMGGILALGGWQSRRPGMAFATEPNPAVFKTHEGNTIRLRIRKIEERVPVVRRGDRKRGPCPVCNHPYEYERLGPEFVRRERQACRGCERPCEDCGLVHEQSPYGADALDCVRAIAGTRMRRRRAASRAGRSS